ncbi:MAG: alpha/beta hydrolase [Pseudomonadota bacterium]
MRLWLPGLAAGLLLSAFASTSGLTQTSPMPSDIADKLKEMGRVIDPPKTAALYAAAHQKEPYTGVKVERDISYGSNERNRLDVFVPEAAGSARPVVIFVHGGGFIRGDKRSSGNFYYDNIMLWAAKSGFVGVNTTYRLAPQNPWPAGAEDIAATVRWVSENIASRGGDPAKVYLIGHSAGAVHVASYVAHPNFHGPKGIGLAGAVVISGLYDITQSPSDAERAYFGTDASVYKERSSLAGLAASKLPLMVTAAELDPPRFVEQYELLKDAACKSARGCARTFNLPQHSHISEVFAINTGDNRLTDQIIDFIKTGK